MLYKAGKIEIYTAIFIYLLLISIYIYIYISRFIYISSIYIHVWCVTREENNTYWISKGLFLFGPVNPVFLILIQVSDDEVIKGQKINLQGNTEEYTLEWLSKVWTLKLR